MHHIAVVLTWIAAVLGAALLLCGAAALFAGRGGTTRQALGCFWFGLFVVVETVARLASWPSGVVLALSVLALVPLALAGRVLLRRE